MEQLLFAARKLVQNIHTGTDDPEGQVPDLPIPDDWANLPTLERYLELRTLSSEGNDKGQGWVAKQDLAAGTLLLVAKPIALVLDSEDDGGGGNGAAAAASSTHRDSTQQQSAAFVDESDDFMMDDDEEDDMVEEGSSSAMLALEETDNANHHQHNSSPSISNENDRDPRVNELLLLEVLDQLNENPSLWTDSLSKLFPRTDAQVAQLPAWICHDDEIFVELENGLKALERQHETLRPVVKDISKRLPLIIRYNILSVETCPELLSYPGPEGYTSLAGVGLYDLPSFFNHSRRPNCARYAVGDVMCFVTNQDVAAGTEVCISYIEHDILCESAYRRNLLLSMDFQDQDEEQQPQHDGDGNENNNHAAARAAAEREGPDMPVVDTDVQNELMSMDALERLTSIDELLAQATGQKGPDDEEAIEAETGGGTLALPSVAEDESMMMSASSEFPSTSAMEMSQSNLNLTNNKKTSSPTVSAGWFQADVQNLRILKAITLEGLGQSQQALALWEEAVQFCEGMLPPLDENGIVVRVQAALTLYQMGDVARAQHHAAAALKTHHLLFGGGVSLFRIRMGPDLRLSLRPTRSATTNGGGTTATGDATDALWPLTLTVPS